MSKNKKLLSDTIELAQSIKENTEDKIKIKEILMNVLQLIEQSMYRETGYHDEMQLIRSEDDFELRGEAAPKTDRVKNLSARISSYASQSWQKK